jgi:hypothetical protein
MNDNEIHSLLVSKKRENISASLPITISPDRWSQKISTQGKRKCKTYELDSLQTRKSGKGRLGYARLRHAPSSCDRTRANARDSVNTRLLKIPRVQTLPVIFMPLLNFVFVVTVLYENELSRHIVLYRIPASTPNKWFLHRLYLYFSNFRETSF